MSLSSNSLMLKNIILFLLIGFSQAAASQTPDSLLRKARQVYSSDPHQGIRLTKEIYELSKRKKMPVPGLKSLKLLSVMYWDSGDYKNAARIADIGLRLSVFCKKDSLTGEFWNTLGLIDYSENNYESAIAKYQKALYYFYKVNMPSQIGIAYLNMGISRKKLSMFEEANAAYLKAAAIFEKIADTSNISGTYNSLGNNFIALSQYKNAVKYYSKALALSLKLKDKELAAQSYNNVGYAYTRQNMPDSAIKYLGKCLQLRRASKDSALLVLTLQNLGEAWKQKGQLSSAITYTRISTALANKLNMKDELLRGQLDLAGLYLSLKKYPAAMQQINAAEALAKKLSSSELQIQAYQLKSSILEQTKNFRKALTYQKRASALHTQLFNIQKDKAISELEIKYEVAQKTKDIQALHTNNKLSQKIVKQQKTLIAALLAGAVLLVALLVITIKSYQHKRKDNMYIQNLMKELHHRVKNNLQILSGLFSLQLAESNDEKVKASIWENEMRINSMNLIHQRLYSAETGSINIKEYLEQLVKNIYISYGGKGRNAELIFDIDPLNIDADKALSIGLIVNELVTNAFKYAIWQENSKFHISMKRMENATLLLGVKDNGKGIDPAAMTGEPTSFGLKLVKIMAAQLNGRLIVKNENGLSYQLELSSDILAAGRGIR